MPKIHVIAVGDARTPLRDELGRWEPGQYLGRDARGDARAQEVEETEQVRRGLARGDLVLAPGPLPPPVPADPPTADATEPPGTEPAPDADRPTPTPEEV